MGLAIMLGSLPFIDIPFKLMGLDSAFMRRGWIREYIEKFVMNNLSDFSFYRCMGEHDVVIFFAHPLLDTDRV